MNREGRAFSSPEGVKQPQHLGMSESDRDDFQEGLGDRGQCPRAQAEAAEWCWGVSAHLYTFAPPLQREEEPQDRAKSLYCLNSCPDACGATAGQQSEKPESLYGL